mmetsp:Transcript_9869/g.22406  ORF Transcript_9869/g.22406 Transcript_9869/m.22406 type:complete len:228 (+) Transcript_9869:770-1453(+)
MRMLMPSYSPALSSTSAAARVTRGCMRSELESRCRRRRATSCAIGGAPRTTFSAATTHASQSSLHSASGNRRAQLELLAAGDPSCPAIEIHPHAVRAAQRRWCGSTRITPHLPSAESPNGSAPCAAPTAHRSRPAARVFRVHDCDSVVSMTCGRSTLVLSRSRTRTRDPATPSVASRDWSPDSTLSSREHNATLATPEQQQEEDHEPRAPKPSGLRARSWSLSRCAT